MAFNLGSRIQHPSFGEGVIFGMDEHTYRIFFKDHGEKSLGKAFDGYKLLEAGETAVTAVELEDVVAAVQNVFDQYYDVQEHIDLGDKWEGGVMYLQPKDRSLKPKEIPVENFFHKIVMLRDRLRVMEQKINAHAVLTDSEKVELQQYITRIYGSLTTFNVLFKSKKDWFVGESTKGEDE